MCKTFLRFLINKVELFCEVSRKRGSLQLVAGERCGGWYPCWWQKKTVILKTHKKIESRYLRYRKMRFVFIWSKIFCNKRKFTESERPSVDFIYPCTLQELCLLPIKTLFTLSCCLVKQNKSDTNDRLLFHIFKTNHRVTLFITLFSLFIFKFQRGK